MENKGKFYLISNTGEIVGGYIDEVTEV